jgi:predicted DNA-binding transcriptional regulator AlpA
MNNNSDPFLPGRESRRMPRDPANDGLAPIPARRHRLSPLVADARRLARLLGLGVRTIRSMDAAGKLPRPIRLGSRVVWVLGGEWGIRAWLAAARNGIPPTRLEWEAMRAAERNSQHAQRHAGRLPR